MALKDWKKQINRNGINTYKNKNYKQTVSITWWVHSNPVTTIYDIKKDILIQKTFKTKSKALAYAKAYMRKH